MRSDKAQLISPRPSSRRSMLKGAMAGTVGVAGVAAAGIFLTEQKLISAHASGLDLSTNQGFHGSSPDSLQTILNVAVTAETLATIFYTHVIHSGVLGFSAAARADLVAAQQEEELHRQFLLAQGAKPLATTFSFPHGQDTFRDFDLFIRTQQWLEALFVAAYILAGKQFAMLGRPDLVQLAAQIGGVEAEHRAIGRAIGGLRPANNLVFESVFLNKVSDAATLLKRSGFLSPTRVNTFNVTIIIINVNGSGMSMTNPSDSDVPGL